MEIESTLTTRTLEDLLGPVNGFKHDYTFESLELFGDVPKPSLDEFKAKYNDLRDRVIPFEELRKWRNMKLNECDWSVGNDSPISSEKIQEWRTYRQALRDLPSTTEDPTNPVWPSIPTA
jgi:hypothetical protein|tara:strand:+ start:165 stop:524 length:360 start_codon:yes stop_codon:yes gene_type:complete